jgi:hypothetical protein
MPHTIFFSWQSDTPGNCGRSFIEGTVRRAIELLAAEVTVESVERDDALAFDSDTQGVAGTPPIVDTIFKKIDDCAVFVSDMTLVAKRVEKDELMPNPNVLVEHGWALNSLTHSRILAVMNTAYGERRAENLPFDLRHMRWPIPYRLTPGASPEATQKERERLALVLKDAIGAILRSPDFKTAIAADAPPPRPFVQAIPKFGQARFREGDAELGVIDSAFTALPGAGKGIRLAPGPAIWLRVMPALDPGKTWPVARLKQSATKAGMHLLPIGQLALSWNYVRAEDGFGYVGQEGSDPTITRSVAFAFITGEIWSIQVLPPDAGDLPNMESWFAQAFARYADYLRTELVCCPINK